MTEPSALSDNELMTRAHQWRRQAMLGAREAGDIARRHEAELRLRFGGASTMSAPLASPPRTGKRKRAWWRVW
ncbi:MAG: hypothetical protein ABWZ88_00650 [Variovorax sp.]